jgi:hypothetical protein
MAPTLGNNPGLEEFLGRIQKRPSSEALVERFLMLVMETEAPIRQRALTRLTLILLEDNPKAALQSCYRIMQKARSQGRSIENQISALELTRSCFEKLGKKNQATVIGSEIKRLREISYEDLAADLFLRLQGALGNFTNIRHQQLAVQSLIKAYQLVYEDMAMPIRKAILLHGRNPLLWTLDGEFRQDLKHYLLEGRLFSMSKDGLSEDRLRMSMELLTGWFDQRLLLPQQSRGKGQELVAQIEFLETALTAIIDRDFS